MGSTSLLQGANRTESVSAVTRQHNQLSYAYTTDNRKTASAPVQQRPQWTFSSINCRQFGVIGDAGSLKLSVDWLLQQHACQPIQEDCYLPASQCTHHSTHTLTTLYLQTQCFAKSHLETQWGSTQCSGRAHSSRTAELTAEQLDPALHSLWWLSVFDVFESFVQEHITCRSIWLANHLQMHPESEQAERGNVLNPERILKLIQALLNHEKVLTNKVGADYYSKDWHDVKQHRVN